MGYNVIRVAGQAKRRMTMIDYKKLQNGSDIRGVAKDGVPGEAVNLSPAEAVNIGRAFAKWLAGAESKEEKDLTVSIGRDPRVTGPSLKDGLAAGLAYEGIQVYDCGLASTPAMFMSTIFADTECDGAVMITASHLPFNRNGFKFFTSEGGLNKNDIKYILTMAQQMAEEGADVPQVQAEQMDIMTLYSAHLRQIIIDGTGIAEDPLAGMKIVVDAGNGSGGFYAKDVLGPLGADVSCSQFLEPDGTFPNHVPNPENKEAMASISSRVKECSADLGIIFDTDVDRSAAVDTKGREIARNGIVAMAAALIADDYPGSTVVTDSITSRQLTEFLEKDLGLKHLRFKRGYKNVINKALDLNAEGILCPLAIETSGHAALKENYFLDDGAYLATKIVIKAARLKLAGMTIDTVIEDLAEPLEEREIRIPIQGEDFGEYGDIVLKDLADAVEKDPALSLEEPNYEGVRINFPEGWCLLRKSLHDPLLPMNIAADEEGGSDKIASWMKGFLEGYDKLDMTVF